VSAAIVGVRFLIAAGAERLLARPGQHDHADLRVPAGAVQCVDQLLAGLTAKRVHDLGAVDGDERDARVDLEKDVLVVHRFSRAW
jgi:hypothetical protein